MEHKMLVFLKKILILLYCILRIEMIYLLITKINNKKYNFNHSYGNNEDSLRNDENKDVFRTKNIE
jgi:hypothetical protein